MANADSTSRNTQSNLLEAVDKLAEVRALAHFIQSISLNVHYKQAITLQPAQLTGFFYVMKNVIDGIKEAEALIETVRKQPEVLTA